jgi:argininosuccinate lyase
VRELNIPFRDAHHITGQIVALAESKNCGLEGLTIADFKTIDERIDSRIHRVLTVEASVAARKSYGGTAPINVLAQAARWKSKLTGEDHQPLPLAKKKHGGHGDGGIE